MAEISKNSTEDAESCKSLLRKRKVELNKKSSNESTRTRLILVIIGGGLIVGVGIFSWIDWPNRTLARFRRAVAAGDVATMNSLVIPPNRFKRSDNGLRLFTLYLDSTKSGRHNLSRAELLEVLQGASRPARRFSDYAYAQSTFLLPTSYGLQTMTHPELTPKQWYATMRGIAQRHGSSAVARFTHGQWSVEVVRGRLRFAYAD